MKDGSAFRICQECGDQVEGMYPCPTCLKVEIELKKREHDKSIFGTVPLGPEQYKIQVLADRKAKR
jgi:hypothetical protein